MSSPPPPAGQVGLTKPCPEGDQERESSACRPKDVPVLLASAFVPGKAVRGRETERETGSRFPIPGPTLGGRAPCVVSRGS